MKIQFLLCALALTAQAQLTLRGTVEDPSSARIPNAKISILGTLAGERKIVAAANAGPDGSYIVQIPDEVRGFQILVEHPGFALLASGYRAANGATEGTANFKLQVGRIQETVEVVGVRPANLPPKAAARPQRIRVGGNVQAANLLRKTNPEYPADLQRQGIEGTVELEAVISREGNVLSLHPRSKTAHEGLIEAASRAVQTWQYKPTLLNGEPIEVVTTVNVRYSLQ